MIEKIESPTSNDESQKIMEMNAFKEEFSPLFQTRASVEIIRGEDGAAANVYSDSVKQSKKKPFAKPREGSSGYDFDALMSDFDL